VVRDDPRDLRREWRLRARHLPLVRTLETDYPWKFEGAGRRGGTRNRYAPLSVDELIRYPLPPLAPDCRLFMWRVGALQQEALEVGRALGFKQKAEWVWIKTTADGRLLIDVDGLGNDEIVKAPEYTNIAFGNGHQVRYSHETCLIFTRGNPPRNEHFRSVFFAPRGEHSEKPDKFYELAERMSPPPRYRMFACEPRPGWMSEYHMAHRGDWAVDSKDAPSE
jgi:N6-adenosine-specific RNA methylase IME4